MKYLGLFILIGVGIFFIAYVFMTFFSVMMALKVENYTSNDFIFDFTANIISLIPILFFYQIGINLYQGKWNR